MKKIATLLCTALLLLPLSSQAYQLPNFGAGNTTNTTSYKEETMGKIFMLSVRHELPILYDPFLTQYINELGQLLAGYSNNPSQTFHFFIVKDGSINAFAGPNGYIAINTGTLLIAQSEGELAAVMAHEIAHVTQHHIMRSIEAQKRKRLPSMAAILAAMIVGAHSSQLGSGAMAAVTAGDMQGSINQTRAYEEEADRVGMHTLKRAGYSSKDMAAFFKRMQAHHRYDDFEKVPEEAYTHPFTTTRLAEALTRSDSQKATKASLTFRLMQARAAVLSAKNYSSILRSSQKQLKQHPDNVSLQYAVALAALRANKKSIALTLFQQLHKKYPDENVIIAGLANAYQANKQPQTGLKLLAEAQRYQPDNVALLLSYADELMQNKKYRDARLLLAPYFSELNDDISYLQLLSQAQGRSGQLSAAHQTRAKLLALKADFPAAITQLHQAIHYERAPLLQKRLRSEIEHYKNEQQVLENFSI